MVRKLRMTFFKRKLLFTIKTYSNLETIAVFLGNVNQDMINTKNILPLNPFKTIPRIPGKQIIRKIPYLNHNKTGMVRSMGKKSGRKTFHF